MTRLIECPGCARHVRADDGRCPFCGRASTTAAPGRMLALVLPLTLMACTSNEPPPPPKPAADDGKVEPAPVPAEPVADDGKIEPVPAEPAYGVPMVDEPELPTDVIDPEPEPIERPADKYGAPPMMDSPLDEPKDVIDPEPEPRDDDRRKTKYGGPPRPKSGPKSPLD